MPQSADPKTFAGKFLEKLDKISHEEIEAFLSRLQNERSFLESVLNHLLEGVVVTDPEGRILFANRAVRQMLGWGGKRRVVGDSFLEQIGDRRLHDALMHYDSTRDQMQNFELSLFSPEERIYQITIIPIRETNGRVVSIVTLFRDLTERRRVEERRIQAERLASLSTLTAGVAHEIKNPLNNLNIHAHLLKKVFARPDELRPETLERASESTAILLEEVQRLSRIVDEFLQAARPSKPQFVLKNVNDVLRKLAYLMEGEVAERRIQVEMELDPAIEPSRIDEIQLNLAFRNLVKNALEAVEPEKGRIWIRSQLHPEHIEITFRDNGCGIAQEQVQKIFEPYVTTKFHGTGLGLMVVYRIITEHKGHVSVLSEEGQWTQITIELPPPPTPRRLLPEKTE